MFAPPSPPAEKATARQDSATRERSAKAIALFYAASWRRRRAKARSPAQAKIRPGSPAPAMGPGTLETVGTTLTPVRTLKLGPFRPKNSSSVLELEAVTLKLNVVKMVGPGAPTSEKMGVPPKTAKKSCGISVSDGFRANTKLTVYA